MARVNPQERIAGGAGMSFLTLRLGSHRMSSGLPLCRHTPETGEFSIQGAMDTVMTDTFSEAERSRIMRAVKSENTTPEMVVRRLAHSMGYRYRLHVRALPGNPDLVFPRLRKIIFVHGCFWHLHGCSRTRVPSSRRDYWVPKLEGNRARDRRVRRALRRAGWRVLIVWECQTRPSRLGRLSARLRSFLSEPVSP